MPRSFHPLDEENADESESEYLYTLHNTSSGDKGVIYVRPEVNGLQLKMELDTGSGVSVISGADYESHFSNYQLNETSLSQKTYSGETIVPIGKFDCEVVLNDQQQTFAVVCC